MQYLKRQKKSTKRGKKKNSFKVQSKHHHVLYVTKKHLMISIEPKKEQNIFYVGIFERKKSVFIKVKP